MQIVDVINKKTGAQGTARELETGRFQIVENGNIKEVAASTFKRWYKLDTTVRTSHSMDEVEIETMDQLEMALIEAGIDPTEEETVQPAAQPATEASTNVQIVDETSQGSKCRKFVTTIEYGQYTLTVVEYDGYVCDVTVALPDGSTYKSPKMSIKDAVENGLGLQGEEAKVAKKAIMRVRRQAKNSIGA